MFASFFIWMLVSVDAHAQVATLSPHLLQRLNLSSTALDFEDPLQRIVKAGKRNLEWMNLINQERILRHQLTFDMELYPVLNQVIQLESASPADPRKYNLQIIEAAFEKFELQAPPRFLQSVLGLTHLSPEYFPLSEAQYLEWSGTLDFLYQTTNRWILFRNQIKALTQASTKDLRGYLFLKNYKGDLNFTLENFALLYPDKKVQFTTALLRLCRNSAQSAEACQAELNYPQDQSLNLNALTPGQYYRKYKNFGETLYNSFYQVTPDPNLAWIKTGKQEFSIITLQDPEDAALKAWMKSEIEGAWVWKNWQLKVNFSKELKLGVTRIRFVEGALPNVTRYAAYTEITLDKNMPHDQLQESETLLHEIGHILGFPDCYVEFYDPLEKLIISYGLDSNNIMCAQNGTVLEKHYQELKRAYSHDR